MSFTLRTAIVIGAKGFVGGNVFSHLQRIGVQVVPVTSQTRPGELPTDMVDGVFFCAGNSAPHLTERDPEFCLRRNVVDVYGYLKVLKYRRWLQVSSSAVYPDALPRKNEEAALDLVETSLYGAHKLLAERYVRQYAPHWVVVRPTYLFGPGLRKNFFYDLRTGQEAIYLRRDSYLRALDVRHLAEAAVTLVQSAENEVFNVGSAHVASVEDLLAMKLGRYQYRDERFLDERGIALDKLHRYWREPLTREVHLQSVRAFIGGADRPVAAAEVKA